MIRNYFSLYHLTTELKGLLTGGQIFEIFSQEKNELKFSIIQKGSETYILTATTDNPKLGIHIQTHDIDSRIRKKKTRFLSSQKRTVYK